MLSLRRKTTKCSMSSATHFHNSNQWLIHIAPCPANANSQMKIYRSISWTRAHLRPTKIRSTTYMLAIGCPAIWTRSSHRILRTTSRNKTIGLIITMRGLAQPGTMIDTNLRRTLNNPLSTTTVNITTQVRKAIELIWRLQCQLRQRPNRKCYQSWMKLTQLSIIGSRKLRRTRQDW